MSNTELPTATLLEDMGINPQWMVSDPERFSEACLGAAAELKAICKEDTSVAAMERAHQKTIGNYTSPVGSAFSDLYKLLDDPDVAPEQVLIVIKQMKDSVKDLETLFHYKVVQNQLNSSSSYSSKKAAHYRYTELRRGYEFWRKLTPTLFDMEFEKMDALPGNYGAGLSMIDTIAYFIDGNDEPWYNYKSVISKLNMNIEDFPTLMDFLNWIDNQATPVVSYKKVTLK